MEGRLVDVGAAQLYCEVRGSGEPLLLVVGLTGGADWFEPLAELLAGRFTVVAYDRRANSRSPRPRAGHQRLSASNPTTPGCSRRSDSCRPSSFGTASGH